MDSNNFNPRVPLIPTLKQSITSNELHKLNLQISSQSPHDFITYLHKYHTRFNSPTFKQAQNQLGITKQELLPKKLEDFIESNVKLEVSELRYQHYLKRIKNTVSKILKIRRQIFLENNPEFTEKEFERTVAHQLAMIAFASKYSNHGSNNNTSQNTQSNVTASTTHANRKQIHFPRTNVITSHKSRSTEEKFQKKLEKEQRTIQRKLCIDILEEQRKRLLSRNIKRSQSAAEMAQQQSQILKHTSAEKFNEKLLMAKERKKEIDQMQVRYHEEVAKKLDHNMEKKQKNFEQILNQKKRFFTKRAQQKTAKISSIKAQKKRETQLEELMVENMLSSLNYKFSESNGRLKDHLESVSEAAKNKNLRVDEKYVQFQKTCSFSQMETENLLRKSKRKINNIMINKKINQFQALQNARQKREALEFRNSINKTKNKVDFFQKIKNLKSKFNQMEESLKKKKEEDQTRQILLAEANRLKEQDLLENKMRLQRLKESSMKNWFSQTQTKFQKSHQLSALKLENEEIEKNYAQSFVQEIANMKEKANQLLLTPLNAKSKKELKKEFKINLKVISVTNSSKKSKINSRNIL